MGLFCLDLFNPIFVESRLAITTFLSIIGIIDKDGGKNNAISSH